MKTVDKQIVQINFNASQANYTIREQGQYLVVPVVMMTEGVHAGSEGPILHQSQYFGQNPEDWNGVPVTASHPEDNGQFVSVRAVDDDQWIVGHVQNAHVEDEKLKAEVAINRQRAIAINPEIINYLQEGKRLDVSIGAFTHDQPQVGTYGDEQYEAVTMRYQPDHLALLPGERGACSWSDGCGIRTNKEQEEDYDMSNIKLLKEQAKKGIGVINGLQANQTGFMEISSRIQSMLDRRDSEAMIHFLKELYDDYFVYEIRNRDQGTQKFYRQEYTFDEEQNDVNFEGERIEVRQDVQYVPIQSNSDSEVQDNCGCKDTELTRTKFNNNKDNEVIMSDKEKQPSSDVMQKVVGLVNNDQTRFGESDQDWLLELTTNQLSKLEPKETPEPEVTREQAVQALQEDLSDVGKLKEIVPESVASKIDKGLSAYNDIREKLIKSIQTNTSEEDWPTDTLEAMETENLKRLDKSVRPRDYSGQGPVNNSASSNGQAGEEPLLPAGVEVQKN